MKGYRITEERRTMKLTIPEGIWSIERILPPIQGTTFSSQSTLFRTTGVLESSTPLCPETVSTSGIRLALSAINLQHGNNTFFKFFFFEKQTNELALKEVEQKKIRCSIIGRHIKKRHQK